MSWRCSPINSPQAQPAPCADQHEAAKRFGAMFSASCAISAGVSSAGVTWRGGFFRFRSHGFGPRSPSDTAVLMMECRRP